MNDSHQFQGAEILIVDDIHENLNLLRQALEHKDFELSVATSGEAALKIVELAPPDLVLLDVMMPGIDGFETCRRMKAMKAMKDVPVIFITAKDELPFLKQGFESGGVDYIVKPIDTEEMMVRIDTHLKSHLLTRQLAEANAELELNIQKVARKNEELEREAEKRRRAEENLDLADGQLSLVNRKEAERWGVEQFIGESRTLERILKEIRRLHRTDTTSVLISGESGTGKELVARAVHHGSGRASMPFIPINCAAVPGELAESLFFGHSKGSFSGAGQDQKGYFVLADGGTLFLDEVGEIPLPLQAKLLRVLEDGSFLPVGASRELKVKVRVIAATNADLHKKISEKLFREDLYYRLARYTVDVPPLRERREDIPLLANHFLQMFAMETGRAALTLSAEALSELKAYGFPGNVRELKNIMERAMIECDGSIVQPSHLRQKNDLARSVVPSSEVKPAMEADVITDELPFNLDQAKAYLIRKAMEQTQGNITQAAKLLGIHRNIIYRHMYDKGSK